MPRPKLAKSTRAAPGDPRGAIQFRPPQSMIDAMDDRATALGMTRNLWLEKAVAHALTLPMPAGKQASR